MRLVYHYPCPDGVYAALAAWLGLGGQNLVFSPLTVYMTETEVDSFVASLHAEEILYFLDFSGNFGLLERACARTQHVYLLDHHKSAVDHLAGLHANATLPANLTTVLDMERSGATIAFDYFNLGKTHPQLRRAFDLIQDHDIWTYKLEGTKAFNAGLLELGIEYDANKNHELFQTLIGLNVDSVIECGATLLDIRNARIAEILTTHFPIRVPGKGDALLQCLAVEVIPSEAHLRSDIGNTLAKVSQDAGHAPTSAIITQVDAVEDKSMWKVSLRLDRRL